MDHSADLGLVRTVPVEAEETDQAPFADPQEVIQLLGGPRLEDPPFELEAPTVHRHARGGEGFNRVQILEAQSRLGDEPTRRLLRACDELIRCPMLAVCPSREDSPGPSSWCPGTCQ